VSKTQELFSAWRKELEEKTKAGPNQAARQHRIQGAADGPSDWAFEDRDGPSKPNESGKSEHNDSKRKSPIELAIRWPTCDCCSHIMRSIRLFRRSRSEGERVLSRRSTVCRRLADEMAVLDGWTRQPQLRLRP
jgi:hypothetical protein